MKKQERTARGKLIGAMTIFGTVGIFRKFIPMSSAVVAMVRGLVGVLFLLAVMAIRKTKPQGTAIRRNLAVLLVSGALIGFNWILLFEAYNYTSVAIGTLCYYMAPVFVVLASPFVLRERLTGRRLAFSMVALLGMILVSDVLRVGFSDLSELKGVFLGLGAAVLYATVILLNQKLKDISAYDKTTIQLASAFVVLVPYVFLTESMGDLLPDPSALLLLLIVGVVHTGFAYSLYFGSMEALSAQTVALYSYIDPILAVILSALLLKEPLGVGGVVGAILILGATLMNELWGGESKAES